MANVVELKLKITKQGKAIEKTEKELKSLKTENTKLNKEMSKTKTSFSDFGKTAGAAIIGVTGALTAAYAATAAFTQQVIVANKELREMQRLSGLDFDDFNEMAYAAQLSGASVNNLADGVNDLNLKITEAANLGSGAFIDVARKLGLSVEELNKLSVKEQVDEFAKAIQKVEGVNVKRLFGDELASDNLIQLMTFFDNYEDFTKKAKDFKNSGGLLSQEDVNRVFDLEKSLTTFSTQFNTSSNEVVAVFADELIPLIQEFTSYMQELGSNKDNNPFTELQVGATQFINTLSIVFNSLFLVSKGLTAWATVAFESISYVTQKLANLDDYLTGDTEAFNNITFDTSKIQKIIDETAKLGSKIGKNFDGIASPELLLNLNKAEKIIRKINSSESFSLLDKEKLRGEVEAVRKEAAKLYKDGFIDSDQLGEVGLKLTSVDMQINDAALKDIKLEFDVKTKQVNFGDLEQQIIKAEKQIGLFKVQLSAGEINEDEFKKQALEANKVIQDNLSVLTENSSGNTKIDYATKLSKANKEAKDISKTLSAESKKLLSQEKELLNAKLKLAELNNDDVEISNIKEALKVNEVKLSNDVTNAKKEEVALIEDLISKQQAQIKEAETLKNFNKEIKNYQAELLSLKGKEEAAAKVLLDIKISEIEANKDYSTELRNQLISYETKLATQKQINTEVEREKDLQDTIFSKNIELLKLKGEEAAADKLIYDNKIKEINANSELSNIDKEKLISLESLLYRQVEINTELDNQKSFNDSILAGQIEIYRAKGQEKLANDLILQQSLEEINLNENLTEEMKKQLILQKEMLTEANNAQAQIKSAISDFEGSNSLDTTLFADNTAYFKGLEDLRNELLAIEKQYNLTAEASNAMNVKIAEDAEKQKEVYDDLAKSMASSFSDTVFSVLDGTNSIEDAFRQMLLNIVQDLFKANLESMFTDLFSGITGAFSSGSGGSGSGIGGLFSSIASYFHTGGVVGQDGFKKSTYVKYHTGGIAGLKPNEVNATLEKGEEILTAKDPRHVNNGGKDSSSPTIINLVDGNQIASVLDGNETFNSAVLNYITANKNEVNGVLS